MVGCAYHRIADIGLQRLNEVAAHDARRAQQAFETEVGADEALWAVLWTDLVQFVIKMTAVIILAVFAVRAVGGMDQLKAGLATKFGSSAAAISWRRSRCRTMPAA